MRVNGKFATDWFRGLSDPQERKEREEYLNNCVVVFGLLREILERQYQEVTNVNTKDYDSPHWDLRTAHKNGRLEELEYIYRLITPTGEE